MIRNHLIAADAASAGLPPNDEFVQALRYRCLSANAKVLTAALMKLRRLIVTDPLSRLTSPSYCRWRLTHNASHRAPAALEAPLSDGNIHSRTGW